MVNSFADVLLQDNSAILNTAEFAKYIEIDGIILRAQQSRHTEQKSGAAAKTFDGLHGDFSTVSFRTQDYIVKKQRTPHKGEHVRINGRRYDVDFSIDEYGITRLELAAYRQEKLRDAPYRRNGI